MTPTAKSPYAGYRFPGEVISHAVWLYFRFPLSLRMVEEMLAARGLTVSHETVRQWARKFGQAFANQIRRRLPCVGDKGVTARFVQNCTLSGGRAIGSLNGCLGGCPCGLRGGGKCCQPFDRTWRLMPRWAAFRDVVGRASLSSTNCSPTSRRSAGSTSRSPAR